MKLHLLSAIGLIVGFAVSAFVDIIENFACKMA
jgi:hypothetical protein